MKRLLNIIIVLAALLPVQLQARTVADFLASEPGNIFTLLTRTNRLDMVDYYNSGQQVAIPNNLMGESRLLELDSTCLKLHSSASRQVEMRLMTAGKDTLIAVIETVKTPVSDSRITFWTSQWLPAPKAAKKFKMPVIDDFIVKKMPADLRQDLQDVMIFPLIQLTFTGDGHDTIEATHGLQQFLSPLEYKRFEQYLRPSIRYRISGTAIKPVR